MNPEKLMTYCGGYCGTCARWKEFSAFRAAATLLAELTDAHSFEHWLPQVATEFDYAEFRKGLSFFADSESWLVCSEPCREGSCGPPFCVRDCCREHRVDVCWECKEYPCEKAEGNAPLIEGVASFRELGKEEWIGRRAEAAAQGYEAHTGMYYRVSVCLGEGKSSSDPGDVK